MPYPEETIDIYTIKEVTTIDGDGAVIFTPDSPPLRPKSYRFALQLLTGDATGDSRQILNQIGRALIILSTNGIQPGDTARYY